MYNIYHIYIIHICIYIYVCVYIYMYIWYIYIYNTWGMCVYIDIYIYKHIRFNKQYIFSTQPHCWSKFSCLMQLQMLLRCCVIIHINIKLRHFLSLYILLLGLCVFMIYVVSMWSACSFPYFLEYFVLFFDDSVDEECE